MDKIYQKLNTAREQVRKGGYKKDGRNDYSKYDYFTPEAVEAIVSEVCEKNKLLTLCNLKADEFGLFQELTLVDLEDGKGLKFELRTTQGEMKATNATQQMGGTDTYSERYIKMKVFQIKDNNLDFDSQDHTPVKIDPDQARKNAERDIKGANNLDVLADVEEKINKSKNLTKKDKEELSYIANERRTDFDPTI